MSQARPAALRSEKRPGKPRSPRRATSGARSGPAITRWSATQKRAASTIESIGVLVYRSAGLRVYHAVGNVGRAVALLYEFAGRDSGVLIQSPRRQGRETSAAASDRSPSHSRD